MTAAPDLARVRRALNSPLTHTLTAAGTAVLAARNAHRNPQALRTQANRALLCCAATTGLSLALRAGQRRSSPPLPFAAGPVDPIVPVIVVARAALAATATRGIIGQRRELSAPRAAAVGLTTFATSLGARLLMTSAKRRTDTDAAPPR